ncbi:GNAT family N-acetyltransferase [Hymenobacter chitinivorans]|uniref:Acetyltransferase (GNAT) family protein n=1 Tax=Hymenobacter chitinivorans DSM 11115 TaxID=1121954 RepID=A0A2M9B9B1_9BACT|nr:GNAT family N-acetyltransferase [Hymenobacter chitinivorans]PJJ54533.1 acetyltransferase (GNAT) family protein [Hymenobacter chitinivorans DSM 11115]
MSYTVRELSAEEARAHIPALTALFQDALDSGAALGFLAPAAPGELEEYWQEVAQAVAQGHRVLLVAEENGQLQGSTQLDLATKSNGLHRAEVCKVMVHRRARRQGLARRLLAAAEEKARQHQRTTLILDTRQHDPSEQLYQGAGYTAAGTIPDFARSSSGELHATVIYYKLLS